MKLILIISFIFSFNILKAGEIDGRGVVCKIYGDTIGYFFEGDRTHEYKLTGGEKKLELTKKEIGKYFTNENYISARYIDNDKKHVEILYKDGDKTLSHIIEHNTKHPDWKELMQITSIDELHNNIQDFNNNLHDDL